MAKNISNEFKAHLAQEATTLVTCWKATLVNDNNRTLGFTDHTRPLVIAGITYDPTSGYTPSAVETMAGFNVDNLEIEGLISSDSITESDLNSGKWDFAQIEIFQVNYDDLTMGEMKLRKGHLGEVKMGTTSFVAELRGLMQAYSKNIGEMYSVTCRADLGDSRCKVNLTPLTYSGTVNGAIVDNGDFMASALTQAVGFFDWGVLTWTSGNNTGLRMEVKQYPDIGHIQLVLPMPHTVQLGDAFTVYRGCNKTLATCKAVFNNVINFRGEPHVPGIDKILTPGYHA